jgi:hypothetical protein
VPDRHGSSSLSSRFSCGGASAKRPGNVRAAGRQVKPAGRRPSRVLLRRITG